MEGLAGVRSHSERVALVHSPSFETLPSPLLPQDGDMMLSPDELLGLLKRLVPGAGHGHARYLRLILDSGEGGKPSGRGCLSCNSAPCDNAACRLVGSIDLDLDPE